MRNILLIEPEYKNKYPPLGLMKISYFHKYIMHDYVRYTKGKLSGALANTKWDHIYVTSLFTFEWVKTIEAIEYAKTLVTSFDQITVGGIAATLLPEEIYQETEIHPVCGLLNKPRKLGLPGDECIDQIVPDYSILDDIEYIYPFHDAYFLSATKGCGMKCGFCAVQTLEPTYIPYMDITEKIEAIDHEFGPKKDLLLMDNNVLKSSCFDQIIDDIIAAGFAKGATYINPKTGKRVRRYVDFNQGLDGNLLTPAKAKRLGEIALRPARIAFDHIEDRETYENAFKRCAENGIIELSNYILYNSEDFGGKGKKYQADTPQNLYDRMRITLDLKDEINRTLPKDQQVSAFSFPMRYIPLSAHERGYVGSKWNPKFLRAIQCMLIPTQGKGVGSRSFFEADFGVDSTDFIKNLSMPDKLIAARGKFSIGGRSHKGETNEEAAIREAKWNGNQRRIKEWNRLYESIGMDKSEFEEIIGDNEFLPEKFLGISSDIFKRLYLHYLTEPRLLSLLGMVNSSSPTYSLIHDYLTVEFPDMYHDLITLITTSEAQQHYIFKNFVGFFSEKGIKDILHCLAIRDFDVDKLLEKWARICKKSKLYTIDFELIRIYRRYVELHILDEQTHEAAKTAILDLNNTVIAQILFDHFDKFVKSIKEVIKDDCGLSILNNITDSISKNMQLKLFNILGDL